MESDRTPPHSIRKQLRNKELTITGSHWPIFVYKNETYDPENPWKGLFRNGLLINVRRRPYMNEPRMNYLPAIVGVQAHFHVPKLSRRRTESNSIRKCENSRHEPCYSRIVGVYIHTGGSPNVAPGIGQVDSPQRVSLDSLCP